MTRVAIVTGAANGIGRAITQSLACDSTVARVFAVDHDAKAGQALSDEHRAVTFLQADLGSKSDCELSVREAVRLGGGLDILVNNVGIQTPANSKPVHELSDEAWHQVLDVNLTSYFRMAKHSLPVMRESGGGVIINMASVQGLQSQQDIPAYAASKGAILSLTRQMALDYSSWGIRVLSVCPGTIRTPLVADLLAAAGKSFDDIRHDDLVMGGVGEPEHIADVVQFLCSDKAAYMTGEAICVDGGIMAKGSWNT